MNANLNASFDSRSNAFSPSLSLESVREKAPAVFAASPHERTSPKYTFIPTERVLSGLIQAGLVPVDARQTKARRASVLHARHVVRLRRRLETVQLKDSVPEVVFLNSHDGTSAYRFMAGIFRLVCGNGLVVQSADFGSISVRHVGGPDFRDRILNVHPSLLPAFKGAHAVREAWEAGVKLTGVTVHFVTSDLDAGPIILQEHVAVSRKDTLKSLEAKIHKTEHRLYPQAVRLFAAGKLKIKGNKVTS